MIRQWPGIYIPSSPDRNQRNPLSSRGPRSINGGGCKIALYLDGVKWPFAFEDIVPEQLAGLEYYASPATTPTEWARLGNHCGVILMHSRYKTGK
jgi:hypothetical protein